LEHEQAVSELNINENVILDFGGMVDPRVLEAIELSKYILMPVTPSMIDIQKCAEDIEGILTAFKIAGEHLSQEEFVSLVNEILSRIIIIVNKNVMEGESQAVVSQIINILKASGIEHRFNYFTIPESRSLKNMHAEMLSIKQMISNSQSPMLLSRSYSKINTVFNQIVQFITQ
jgi:hypothetical protein